jgi:hypothetical protein
MTVCTAAKLIPLLAIINHKKQRTNDINNNPLTTKFQRDALQATIATGWYL